MSLRAGFRGEALGPGVGGPRDLSWAGVIAFSGEDHTPGARTTGPGEALGRRNCLVGPPWNEESAPCRPARGRATESRDPGTVSSLPERRSAALLLRPQRPVPLPPPAAAVSPRFVGRPAAGPLLTSGSPGDRTHSRGLGPCCGALGLGPAAPTAAPTVLGRFCLLTLRGPEPRPGVPRLSLRASALSPP